MTKKQLAKKSQSSSKVTSQHSPEKVLELALWNKISNAQHIVIVSHKDPDGDAIAGILALWHMLQQASAAGEIVAKREVIHMFNPGPKPVAFQFLPGFEEIEFDAGEIDWSPKGLVVVGMDYASWSRTGLADHVAAQSLTDAYIVTIDHHPPRQEQRGAVVLVNPDASSCCEMLFYTVPIWNKEVATPGIEITRDIATCLMTGIITDTGGFKHANTSQRTLKAAEALLLQGAPMHQLMTLFTSIPREAIGIWQWAIGAIQFDEAGQFAYCLIPHAVLKQFQSDSEALGGLSNVIATIPEARFGLLLREEGTEQTAAGTISGSLRSTTEHNYDCSALAQKLGGGGHRLAAGFTGEGTLEQVLEKVRELA
ncbi:MAG: Phosphoesterase RecJ domain protein [Parcubacteria group bacterium GW2011_GWA2_47_8]|nr:MAG: Phosphoesterase RecJ domain protein [Parcubacteria group bacterium GW2011_GWA2_47_8]